MTPCELSALLLLGLMLPVAAEAADIRERTIEGHGVFLSRQ